MMDVDDVTSAAAVPVSASGGQAEAWRGFTVAAKEGAGAGLGLARLSGGHTACVRCVCGGGGGAGGGTRALLTGGEDARLCVWMPRDGAVGRGLGAGGKAAAASRSGKVDKKSKKSKKDKTKKEKKKKKKKKKKASSDPY